MADIPHLAHPFQIIGRSAVTVDQDSDPEIERCVWAVLSTEAGTRDELPEYGIEDPTFHTREAITADITDTVREWEPRVAIETTADIEELIMNVKVEINA